MKILITGGAGYIGSVTNALLVEKGFETVIFDNMSTGHTKAVGNSQIVVGDLKNKQEILRVFEKNKFDAVIHFAALALAGESMQKPYEYYENNILGGLHLLEAMRSNDCSTIIFSSTCAVYGYPARLPVSENESYKPVSVYGSSKRMFEQICEWYEQIYKIRYAFLRYFNAAGAMLDGSLGEYHQPESHIIPIAMEVASGKRDEFQVFGNDYHTPDGTCIRDYIHILDLAYAHIQAVEYIQKHDRSLIVNLGVGRGYTNLEVLTMIEKITGKHIPKKFVARRAGDPDAIYADNTQAKKILGWEPLYSDLETIVKTAWIWHKNHPEGYQ